MFHHSLDKADKEMETCLQQGSPLAMSWYIRKTWGEGKLVLALGEDIWDVEGFEKATLNQLLIEGKMKPYRNVPPQVIQVLNATIAA